MRAASSPVDHLDWGEARADLDAYGCANAGRPLATGECAALAGLYAQDAPFRSRDGARVFRCSGDPALRARHGVGRITAGERFTTGLIFHDAT